MIFPFLFAALLQQPRAKPLGWHEACGIFVAATCGVNCIGQNGWKNVAPEIAESSEAERECGPIMKMNENR